ncbi:hypothetical protein AQI88_29360 [Streptomyces cellostaticus]|uniref:Subtilisin inhibitor domain-containing protein n=1 Tax=Streptomyces cellostaticus TaxID=67285 RepID=A0A101NHC6_9ACTN|nr:hypothetical protein AQI88_29360 [Streptomyces cellostaticus]
MLSCDPPSGPHPKAAEACKDLDASEGKLERPTGTVCILIYAPVIAQAEGLWHGRPVSFKHTYGNDCELRAGTRSVFAF